MNSVPSNDIWGMLVYIIEFCVNTSWYVGNIGSFEVHITLWQVIFCSAAFSIVCFLLKCLFDLTFD